MFAGIATALTVHAELYKGFEAEEEDMCYLIVLKKNEAFSI